MTTGNGANPFKTLKGTQEIVDSYRIHRTTRNKVKQAELSTTLKINPDPILQGLIPDPRNCITIWAIPPAHIRALVARIQRRLAKAIDSEYFWTMPEPNLHLSVLEIAHSQPVEVVEQKLSALRGGLEEILRMDQTTSLVEPKVCFDENALALTFVPNEDFIYTYSHLRADLWERSSKYVDVSSRYAVPSAHVTIARFVGDAPAKQVEALLRAIEEVNEDLDSNSKEVEWRIGENRGLVCKCGKIWYGGGWIEAEGNLVASTSHHDI